MFKDEGENIAEYVECLIWPFCPKTLTDMITNDAVILLYILLRINTCDECYFMCKCNFNV